MLSPDPQTPSVDRLFADGGEMGERMRAHAWESTPLGPVADWPPELCAAVSIALNSRFPMFVAWGPELTFFYNDPYVPVLGPTKHPRALGRPMAEIWTEIWDSVEPRMRQVLETGQPTWDEDFQFTFDRNLPREEVYFTFSYSPIRSAEGHIAGVFCACTEVTERVIGERRLRLLRDFGARLAGVRSVDEACELAGQVLEANDHDIPYALIYRMRDDGESADLCGRARAEGNDHAPRVLTLRERKAESALREALATGRPVLVRDIQRLIGQHLPYGPWPEGPHTAAIVPLFIASQHKPFGLFIAGLSPRRIIDDDYVGFVELVASRIARAFADALAHEHASARQEAMAALDRAKTTFFSNVSHEFRTPLTLMLGPLAELRERDGLDADAREHIELVQRNGQRLLRLVNSLLDFSRIEAGRVGAGFEPVELGALTRDLTSTFRSTVERGGLSLELELAPLAEPVWVDRDLWETLVFNLLSNAFKFTLRGSIGVSLRDLGDHVELRVSDTGCGIPEADLELIFERFHRVRAPAARSIEGSGIGLALVNEIVRLHGGRVTVSSRVGAGTTFVVTVPRGAAHLGREPGPPQSARIGAEAFVGEAQRWLPSAVMNDGLEAPPTQPEVAAARVVVVDDNADMREYLTRLLSPHWRVATYGDVPSALAAVRMQAPDLIVSDIMLPGDDGLSLLHAVRADPSIHGIPIILLSARAGEEARVEGFKAGADDYLVKPFSARELIARIAGALRLAAVRRETASQLRAADERFRLLQLATNDIIWDYDFTTGEVVWNDELERQTGWARSEVGPMSLAWAARIHPEDVDRVVRGLQRAVMNGTGSWTAEYRVRKKDGSWVTYLDRAFIVRDEQQRPLRMIGALLDVTERERLAEEVRRAERLQAAGKLAGGMAHEVNNMMTAVLGFGDFVLRQLPDESSVRCDIEEMVKAGERAARVTQQLLAFTRRQVLQPTLVDVNQVVRELASPLERLAGATVMIATELSPRAGRVRVDRTQLEQVLINLVHNARDAMPSGGAITIATSEIFVEQRVSGAMRGDDLEPGRHSVLTVRDTGVGMDDRTLKQAFEPFFTTKPTGQGTGLGLSTVYGTVRQSGGHITLDSVPGVGTTVTIYLPTIDEPPAVDVGKRDSGQGGTERILVVEDERVVRSLVARTLADKGFEVIEAEDGIQALQILKQRDGKVDLVLSDVVMPRLAGRELGYAIKARYPGLTVLFMSGYTGDEILQRGLMDADALFLPKPFTADQLVEKLREVLDRTRPMIA